MFPDGSVSTSWVFWVGCVWFEFRLLIGFESPLGFIVFGPYILFNPMVFLNANFFPLLKKKRKENSDSICSIHIRLSVGLELKNRAQPASAINV